MNSMQPLPIDSNAPVSFLHVPGRGLGFLVLVLTGLTALCGCPSNKAGGGKRTSSAQSTTISQGSSDSGQQSQHTINSIYDIFNLDQLGFTSTMADGVALLNQWLRNADAEHAAQEEFEVSSEVAESLSKLVPEEELRLIKRRTFVDRDGYFLRDTLLTKAMAQAAIAGAKDDRERIQKIFHHVVISIDLVSEHRDGIPLTLYTTTLLGKGTAADRAWLMVEMLRQLRIDAVLLTKVVKQPATDDEEWDASRTLLVAVPLNSQIYLFDPQMGLPITKVTEQTENVSTPEWATLSEVLSQPAILTQYDLDKDHPYPLTAADLSKSAVWLVGNTSLWSERTARLQEAFTGDHALVLHESLVTQGKQPGTFERLREFGKGTWSTEQIRAWPYPEEQLAGAIQHSAQHKQVFASLTSHFAMPFEKVEKKSAQADTSKKDEIDQQPEFRLTFGFIKTRLAHVQGRYAEALKGYTGIQLQTPTPREMPMIIQGEIQAAKITSPQDAQIFAQRLLRMYEPVIIAGEGAAFWGSMIKAQEATPEAHQVAREKFDQYARKYPGGTWAVSVVSRFAELAEDEKNYALADALLNQIPPTHPQAFGFAWRRKQWKHLLPAEAQSPMPPETKPGSTPAPTNATESQPAEARPAPPELPEEPAPSSRE